MSDHWIQTHSGRALDLLEPCVHDIWLADIVRSLARQNRYLGHVGPYNVAQHSVACSITAGYLGLPESVQLAVLMHDAAEAYIGDIPAPLKRLLMPILGPIEERLEDRIAECFGLDTSPDAQIWIAKIDHFHLHCEAGVMYPVERRPRSWKLEVPQECFTPWALHKRTNISDEIWDAAPPEHWMSEFVSRAESLGIAHTGQCSHCNPVVSP